HFRLQVVRSNFWRRTKNPALSLESSFAASGEEERYVGILLGLRDSDLCSSGIGHHLAQRLVEIILLKYNPHVFKGLIVHRQRDVVKRDFLHRKLWEILLRQDLGDLPSAISTEVKAKHNVAFLDSGDRLIVVVVKNDGFDKLVRNVIVIGLPYSLYAVGGRGALPVNQQVVGQFHPLPSFIAVHCVVASDNGGQASGALFHMRYYISKKSGAALRIRIAPIHKSMEKEVSNPFSVRN